jgi:cytochrome c oxidase subunit 2
MKYLLKLYLILFVVASCNKSSPKKMDYEKIMKEGPNLFLKYGCIVCHSLEGKIIYGPPLNDIFMKEIKVIRNGKEITRIADREYLLHAITDPRAEKVLVYQNKEMPETSIPKEDAAVLVEYLILLNEKK